MTDGGAQAEVFLQEQVAVLAWLLAEMTYRQMRIAAAVAQLLADNARPQVQRSMYDQLMA